jgi:hydroxyacylglutathione hydrolase
MLHIIPAFTDNYLWLLATPAGAWAVDPGDAAPVQAVLDRHGLQLAGILITHHHPDHVGGLARLVGNTKIPVYGPAENIAGITTIAGGGEKLDLPGIGTAQVIATPGHTRGHIAWHLPAQDLLFCGDTLFSSGCGRLFEGTPEQMHASLSRLSALPDATRVCCAHEYTQANLRFALAVEPGNTAITERIREVGRLRESGQPSVPSLLANERRWNPFLRCDEPVVIAAAAAHAGRPLAAGAATFAVLRAWKDSFRG